jgi:hypothetical protein
MNNIDTAYLTQGDTYSETLDSRIKFYHSKWNSWSEYAVIFGVYGGVIEAFAPGIDPCFTSVHLVISKKNIQIKGTCSSIHIAPFKEWGTWVPANISKMPILIQEAWKIGTYAQFQGYTGYLSLDFTSPSKLSSDFSCISIKPFGNDNLAAMQIARLFTASALTADDYLMANINSGNIKDFHFLDKAIYVNERAREEHAEKLALKPDPKPRRVLIAKALYHKSLEYIKPSVFRQLFEKYGMTFDAKSKIGAEIMVSDDHSNIPLFVSEVSIEHIIIRLLQCLLFIERMAPRVLSPEHNFNVKLSYQGDCSLL